MKRIDFVALISASHCNPNGDPTSEGNMPRMDNDGYGILSSVCIKRKIRDRVQDLGGTIMAMSDTRKNDSCTSLAERVEQHRQGTVGNQEFAKKLLETYWDARAFGSVIAYKVKEEKGSTSVSCGLRGAVSISDAFTVCPVSITDMGITKSFNGIFVDPKKDLSGMTSDRMGRRFTVDHGLYMVKGTINPFYAEKAGFTEDDAKLLKAALASLFENDESAARPAGSMVVERVFWFEHEGDDESAKAPSISTAGVQRSITVTPLKDAPRSIDDYDIVYNGKALEGKNIKTQMYSADGTWTEI